MILPFRKAVIAAAVVATVAAVVAALLFRSSGKLDGETPPAPVMERAHLPLAPVPQPVNDVPEIVAEPLAVATRATTALCSGCLDERGVLDVAEGLLSYVERFALF